MMWCKNSLYNFKYVPPTLSDYGFSEEVNIFKWKNKKKCWGYYKSVFFYKRGEVNKALRKYAD